MCIVHHIERLVRMGRCLVPCALAAFGHSLGSERRRTKLPYPSPRSTLMWTFFLIGPIVNASDRLCCDILSFVMNLEVGWEVP